MYKRMKVMRDEIAVVENLRQIAEQLAKAEQTKNRDQEI